MVLTSHGELGKTGKETGFFLSEVSHPFHVFSKAGFEMTFVSPKGGKAPMDGVNREDAINVDFLDDPKKVGRTLNTVKASEVKASDYDAIFFAGGHGTMWDLPDDPILQRLTADIYEKGGVVAAVCHGPVALVNVKLSDGEYLVKGKRVAAFTNAEETAVELTEVVPFLLESKMRERGAEFIGVENFKANVAVSDRLITGQNPASAMGVAEQVVKRLSR
ncbi:MAG: type 1 glutamine amidotransferase domain-containing protein [Bradymonadia bacterium]